MALKLFYYTLRKLILLYYVIIVFFNQIKVKYTKLKEKLNQNNHK